jgi:transposase
MILLPRDSEANRMRRNLFWLNDDQWSRIEPYLPTDVRGKERVDDRRVISGILHEKRLPVVRLSARIRSAHHDLQSLRALGRARCLGAAFPALAARGRSDDTQMIDSTHVKAHRSASGAKRGNISRRLAARAAGETRKSTQSQMLKAVFFPSF